MNSTLFVEKYIQLWRASLFLLGAQRNEPINWKQASKESIVNVYQQFIHCQSNNSHIAMLLTQSSVKVTETTTIIIK